MLTIRGSRRDQPSYDFALSHALGKAFYDIVVNAWVRESGTKWEMKKVLTPIVIDEKQWMTSVTPNMRESRGARGQSPHSIKPADLTMHFAWVASEDPLETVLM